MKLIKILKQTLREQDEEHEIATESDMEKILRKSSKLTGVLCKLLSSQKTVNNKAKEEIRSIVSDIRCVSFNPSIFRILLKNGSFFQVKYSPSPLQIKYKDDFDIGDSFTVLVAGKSYDIGNKSEYQQALDYINKLQQEQPVNIGKDNPDAGGGEGGDEKTPDTGGEEPQEDEGGEEEQ